MLDHFTVTTIITIIIAAVIGGFLLLQVIGYAIKDQRQAAEAVRVKRKADRRAATGHSLKELRSMERRRLDRVDEVKKHAKEYRDKLPVWKSWEDNPSEEVQAYARRCLDDRRLVFGAYEIKYFEDAPMWLSNVASHCFYLDEAVYELEIAKATLEAAKTTEKIAKLERFDDDIAFADSRYKCAKSERKQAKKIVVFLEAELTYTRWSVRKYLKLLHQYAKERHACAISLGATSKLASPARPRWKQSAPDLSCPKDREAFAINCAGRRRRV